MLLAEAAGDMLENHDWSRLKGCLDELGQGTQQSLKEMRLLLFQLRPMLTGGQDLEAALRIRLEAVERRAGVTAQLEAHGKINLPARVQDEIYRIAIEALNNSLKHSGSNTVTVRLAAIDDGFQLTVEDRGRGFDLEQNRSAGMGLTDIQERAAQLGGRLQITSAPGEGTVVTVEAPL